MHSSSELHVPIITVTLLEPEDVVMNVGEGLATDKALMTVGVRVVLVILVGHSPHWLRIDHSVSASVLPKRFYLVAAQR